MDAPLSTLSSTSPPFTRKGVGGLSLTIDRHLAGITIAGNLSVGDRCIRRNWCDASLQAEQINVAAAIQRQGGHFLVFDDVAKLCAAGIHLRRGATNFDGFGYGTDDKLEVSPVLLVEYELDSALNGLFEPFRLGLDTVFFSNRDR